MDIRLSSVLAPVGTYDLIRLGREKDGGYLVDPRAVAASTRLVSFGMADDWSFEEEFRKANPVPVDIYDHSVSGDYFFRRAFQHLLRWDRLDQLRAYTNTWRQYRRFFRGDVRHHETRIGYDSPGWSLDLHTVFDNLLGGSRSKRAFLKIDIECWEYRLLDQIIDRADLIEGLAIEFHSLDLHMPRLEDFVARFPLQLCHIHLNNAGGVSPDGVPLTLELSFSRYAPQDTARPDLPHPLDSQNADHLPPHRLTFGKG